MGTGDALGCSVIGLGLVDLDPAGAAGEAGRAVPATTGEPGATDRPGLGGELEVDGGLGGRGGGIVASSGLENGRNHSGLQETARAGSAVDQWAVLSQYVNLSSQVDSHSRTPQG